MSQWNAMRVRAAAAALLAAVLGALLMAAPAQGATVGFTPGKARQDTSGAALQLHGLGIVKVGATWYGFGEDKAGESAGNTSFQDIPCYASTDLANWTLQGHALAGRPAGTSARTVSSSGRRCSTTPSTRTYVMYLHIDNSCYSEAKVGVATSSTPCGPYTYRGSFQPLGHQSRDIGLFQDTDGTGVPAQRGPGQRPAHRPALRRLPLGDAAPVARCPAGLRGARHGQGRRPVLPARLAPDRLGHQRQRVRQRDLAVRPLDLFQDFAPAGTNTYNSQTANIITVQGTRHDLHLRGRPVDHLGSRASPLIWLPLTISGTTATVSWQNSWSLDLTAGTWSASSRTRWTAPRTTHQRRQWRWSWTSTAGRPPTAPRSSSGATTAAPTSSGRRTASPERLHLVNVNSGRCLEDAEPVHAQGIQLDQGTCDGDAGEQWALDAVGDYTSSADTSYQLVNLSSGWVADVSGASTSTGSAVVQWISNGGGNQTWSLS